MPSPSVEKSDFSSEVRCAWGRPWTRWAEAPVTEAPAPVNFCPLLFASIRMSIACGEPVKGTSPPG